GEEMSPVLADAFLIQHPQESLVYQSGRSKRVVAPLAPQLSSCQFSELIIDERHQLRRRRSTAITPFSKQIGKLIAGCVAHVHHPRQYRLRRTKAPHSSPVKTRIVPARCGRVESTPSADCVFISFALCTGECLTNERHRRKLCVSIKGSTHA